MDASKVEECFDVIDADNGGTISIDEFEAFNTAQAKPCTREELEAVFLEVDADGSGEVDKEEFVELVQKLEKRMGVSMAQMAEAFERQCYNELFGLVGDGAAALKAQELRAMVEGVNQSLRLGHSLDDIRKIFKAYDEDGSGALEMEEFETVMKTIGKRSRISTLLWAFNEYKKAARARMARFRAAFGDDSPKPKPKPRAPAASDKPCPHCADHLERIKELEARLAKMAQINQELENQLEAEMATKFQLKTDLENAQRAADAAKKALGEQKKAPRKKVVKNPNDGPCPPWWELSMENVQEKLATARKALSVRTAAMTLMVNRLKAPEEKTRAQQGIWVSSLESEVTKASLDLLGKEVDAALRRDRLDLDAVVLRPSDGATWAQPTGVVVAQHPSTARLTTQTQSFRVPKLEERTGLDKPQSPLLASKSFRDISPRTDSNSPFARRTPLSCVVPH